MRRHQTKRRRFVPWTVALAALTLCCTPLAVSAQDMTEVSETQTDSQAENPAVSVLSQDSDPSDSGKDTQEEAGESSGQEPASGQESGTTDSGKSDTNQKKSTKQKQHTKKSKTKEKSKTEEKADTEEKSGTEEKSNTESTEESGKKNQSEKKTAEKSAPNAPEITGWERVSDTSMKLSWKAVSDADGYQIQYSESRTFANAKTVRVRDAAKTERTIRNLPEDATCYVRIRAYVKDQKTKLFSDWSAADNIKKSASATLTQVRETNSSALELRRCAGQKLGEYDTARGSCTDGVYAYYLMVSGSRVKGKILKVSLANNQRVAVSDSLDAANVSDMTYDSTGKRIVLSFSKSDEESRIAFVDPDSLKLLRYQTVALSGQEETLAASDVASSGFSGIAYSAARGKYVAMVEGSHHLLILNEDMQAEQVIKTEKDNSWQFQGLDATDDYILTCVSPANENQKYCMITIYDWSGNQISVIRIKKGYELESIYHVDDQFYATFFCQYYKNSYQTVGKKVSINGTEQIRKVKRPVRTLQRDNFVYQFQL